MMIGISTGLLTGLVHGLLLAAFYARQHHDALTQIKADYCESLLGLHQVQVITLRQSFEETFEACRAALKKLKGSRIVYEEKYLGVIRAQTGISWGSFGEQIMFTASPSGQDCSRVSISSKPVVTVIMLDRGKNVQNIRSIVAALAEPATVVEPQLPGSFNKGAKLISTDLRA
jgi:hypothetical protein